MSVAFAAFFASHAVPARPAVRRLLHARFGAAAYAIVYSLVSLVVLAWLIAAAAHAPRIQLWDFELWQLWVPNLVMPLVCLLIAFGLAAPNPFSITGLASRILQPRAAGHRRRHPAPSSLGDHALGRGAHGPERRPGACPAFWAVCLIRRGRHGGAGWAQTQGVGREALGRASRQNLVDPLRSGVIPAIPLARVACGSHASSGRARSLFYPACSASPCHRRVSASAVTAERVRRA